MDRRLIDYLPPVLQGVREYKVICNTAEQPEAEEAWASAFQGLADQFLLTAGEYGIARHEMILGILPKGTETLEERRFRVIARYLEQLPFTIRALRDQMDRLCGTEKYLITLNHDAYSIRVSVALSSASMLEDVRGMVRRMVPANLAVEVGLLYTQHYIVARYTHEDLAAFTHQYIREELLNNG